MTLLWKRRDYLLSSRFTITFPFLPKQQRKYWLRRLPANFIWQILSHFLCVYTNYHNDAFEGLFLSSTWNSWTHPNGHPVLPTFWSLWIKILLKHFLSKSAVSILDVKRTCVTMSHNCDFSIEVWEDIVNLEWQKADFRSSVVYEGLSWIDVAWWPWGWLFCGVAGRCV